MLDLLLAAVVLGAMTWLVADTVRLGAPPMPSNRPERRAVIDLLRRFQSSSQAPLRVVEAGAGWGGLAAMIARELDSVQVLAIEGAAIPAMWCKLRARSRGYRTRWGDARRCSLDVVVAFLGPEATADLAARLRQDHPSVHLVSVGFAVRGWHKVARVSLSDSWSSEVAVWRPPGSGPPDSDTTSGQLEPIDM